MTQIDDLYVELETHIENLEKQFIQRFLNSDPQASPASPEDYDYLVRAYCVLSHAAFEEYFESTTLRVMTRSIEEWRNNRKVTDTIVSLVAFYGSSPEVDQEESNSETKAFDYLRPMLDDVKRRFSTEINNNHGISPKYLCKLLIPIGIDVIQDPALTNSVRQLAKERGSYAHERNSARRVLAPEDAKEFVRDCLKLCEDVRDKANAKLLVINGA